jgi:predicted enzyme related to lactoylglutathione lyase
VTIHVGVEDLAGTLEWAEEFGGKTVVEPMPIPGVGTIAMFQDPDGVMLGLFQENPPAGSHSATER